MPADEQGRVVLAVIKGGKCFGIVPRFSAVRRQMFEGIPVLVSKPADFLHVQVRHTFQHMRRKRPQVLDGGNALDHLSAPASQALNGDRVTIANKQVKGRAELVSSNVQLGKVICHLTGYIMQASYIVEARRERGR
jgi:hypothetical protein